MESELPALKAIKTYDQIIKYWAEVAFGNWRESQELEVNKVLYTISKIYGVSYLNVKTDFEDTTEHFKKAYLKE